jgi:N-methylhydantoinase B
MAETESDALDPVTLALVQNRLDHIARQMGWVMIRTARSPIFNQAHDFSCFIADAAGTLVSQADGIPIHTGGGGFSVRALLAAFGDTIAEGDVFLSNDPYAAGGNHLPDWVVARPVFAGGRLVAFTCNRAHQSDIGGGAAGTYNPRATEIFHEGIRLPPLRLAERGAVREDLWELLMLNTRCPDLLDGDLRAMMGSTRVGAQQVVDLVDGLGLDAAQAYFEGILAHADARFRAAVAALPDGTWRAEEHYDNDCFEPVDVLIRTTVTVAGDRLTVDFDGTSPQIRGFKNSSLANTYSAVYAALASFFDPAIPRNEGTFRCVEIRAPEGTVVNARAPAPMTMCTVFPAHEIMHTCWWALGQAAPERSCAGWGKNSFPNSSGLHPDGSTWVMYHWLGLSGGGAVEGRDGFEQIGPLVTLGGLMIPNAETYEQLYPVAVRRHELRTDGGGPGRWRGGTGTVYEADTEVPSEYSFRAEGLSRPTGLGVLGGGDGAKAELMVTEPDGRVTRPPSYDLRRFGPSRFHMCSPGGGGYGDPLERDPERVLADVLDEVVSPAAAKEAYGVVLSADGRAVDADATARLRAARSAQQGGQP